MTCKKCSQALSDRDEVESVGTDAVVSVLTDFCRDHGIRIDADDPRRGIAEAIRPAPEWGRQQGFAYSVGAPEWDIGTLRQTGLDGGGRLSIQVWACHATDEPLIGVASMTNLTADQAEKAGLALLSAARRARAW